SVNHERRERRYPTRRTLVVLPLGCQYVIDGGTVPTVDKTNQDGRCNQRLCSDVATATHAVSVLVDRHHSALGLQAWLNRPCCLCCCLSCPLNSCWMSFDRYRRHLCCWRRAAAFCA